MLNFMKQNALMWTLQRNKSCVEVPLFYFLTTLDTSDVKSNTADFQLPYDHLVLAIGAVNNTYNTPG